MRTFSILIFGMAVCGFGATNLETGYYLRLQNEEFIQTMMPKEQYLLDLVRVIQAEIKERNLEGADTKGLGIDIAISPKETILNQYVQELERIVGFSREVVKLEQKARLNANMQALESIANLKLQIQNILKGNPFLPDTQTVRIDNQASVQNPNSSSNAAVSSNLFGEWKYNQLLNYKTRQTLYLYIRARLVNTASLEQKKRMFQRELRFALEQYSAGNYALARMEFKSILEQYGRFYQLDDVLFFSAECDYAQNHLDDALSTYRLLLEQYPGSSYKAKALSKILYMDFLYQETDRLFADYQLMLVCQAQLDRESFGAVSYLVGLAHFKSKNYAKAIACLEPVAANTSTFYPALYLSAVCHSNLGNDREALTLYHRIADQENRGNKDPVLTQMKNNTLIKLGLIYYERGENRRAITLFNQVSQDFQFFDLSLLGKAWSAYRSGKPVEALENAERVVRHNVFSSYAYEAKVLAARAKELLGKKDDAIDDLKQIQRTGSSAAAFEQETRRLQQVEDHEQGTLEDRNRELFVEADRIKQFLNASQSGSGSPFFQRNDNLSAKVQRLSDQIRLLDSLETGANSDRLETIRSLRGEMLSALRETTNQNKPMNPAGDPLIQRMGMSQYLKYLFGTLLRETLLEKEETRKSIREAADLAGESRKQNQTRIGVMMEIKQEELEDYLNKLNQYEIWLRENSPQEFRVDLDYWASFSEYGISNINFLRIQEIDRRIADISKSVKMIDRVYDDKRLELEKRIQGLLDDVAQIEKQMRLEEEKRTLKEKERFFKNEYFERQGTEPSAGQLMEKPENEKQRNP